MMGRFIGSITILDRLTNVPLPARCLDSPGGDPLLRHRHLGDGRVVAVPRAGLSPYSFRGTAAYGRTDLPQTLSIRQPSFLSGPLDRGELC